MFKKPTKGNGFKTKEVSLRNKKGTLSHPIYEDDMLGAELFEAGTALCQRGQYSDGIELLVRSLAIRDDVAAVHFNLGKAYAETSNIVLAKGSFLSCIRLNAEHVEAYIELASCYKQEDDLASSEVYLGKALSLKEDHYGAWYNLGGIYARKHDYQKAIECYKKAISIEKGFLKPLTNMALSYKCLGNINKAIELTRKHIEISPGDPLANKNLGIYLLEAGEFQEGWERYEYRFTDPIDPVDPYIKPSLPRLEKDSENDTRLLIVSEQGLGDTIQFCRYIPEVRKRYKHIQFCCPSDLHQIIIRSDIEHNPVDKDSVCFADHDAWIPLLSLPGLLGINEPARVDGSPYIRYLPHTRDKLFEKVESSKLIVGIHWQGSMRMGDEAGKIGVGRSFRLERFRNIALLDDVMLISLQIGAGTEQIEECGFLSKFLIAPSHNETRSLMQTVELIGLCDLVITNDTSIAHLSSAMGVETHILLKRFPDWRWGQTGRSTYWYQSAILHRQDEIGCWDSVFDDVYQHVSLASKKARQA